MTTNPEAPGSGPAGESSSPVMPLWSLSGLAALAVLGLFLFEIQGILNPFILFLVFVALLLPFRGGRGHTLVVTLTGLLTLYWLLQETGFLIAPFVLGLVLAYVLDPLVDRLEDRGIGRALAIVLLAMPVLGLAAAAIIVGVPAVMHQVNQVIQGAPAVLSRVIGWVDGGLNIDLPGIDEAAILARLRDLRPETIVAFLQERWRAIASAAASGVLGLGSGLGTALSVLGYGVLTPVLTFYLLRDYDRIKAKARQFIPRPNEAAVVEFAREYDQLLSSYLRGQLTVALILGALMATGLLITRFPYALLLGSLVGVLSLVPYLGLALSLIPAVIIALASGSVVASLVKLAVVYAVTQTLEGTVISPRIVGESVGLHPVWVVLALSIAGFFFGFVGFLIAIPLAVGVKLLVVRAVARYRDSEIYLGVAGLRGEPEQNSPPGPVA
ncbi:MAG: AI-2E family transporter [Gemmatimonadota bacterium]|nr:MAG: AI-2E family transporter [Gemmatimonadota bacterium]